MDNIDDTRGAISVPGHKLTDCKTCFSQELNTFKEIIREATSNLSEKSILNIQRKVQINVRL